MCQQVVYCQSVRPQGTSIIDSKVTGKSTDTYAYVLGLGEKKKKKIPLQKQPTTMQPCPLVASLEMIPYHLSSNQWPRYHICTNTTYCCEAKKALHIQHVSNTPLQDCILQTAQYSDLQKFKGDQLHST